MNDVGAWAGRVDDEDARVDLASTRVETRGAAPSIHGEENRAATVQARMPSS